jgi:hypothetical protein
MCVRLSHLENNGVANSPLRLQFVVPTDGISKFVCICMMNLDGQVRGTGLTVK